MRVFCISLAALMLAMPAYADGFGFRTPSGNIYCNGGLDGAHVDCVIVNREKGSAPAGISCPAGRSFAVSLDERGRARGDCGRASVKLSTYSDIADFVLTGRFGKITCLSERTGFSCQNADGHGFFLSRRSQKIY